MEIKAGAHIETKSLHPYIASKLEGFNNKNINLDATTAFWLWENSDTIGDACDRICWAFEQLNPVLKDKKTSDYIEDHPLIELIKNPGYKMTSDRLQFELMKSFLVAGECFPVLEGNVNYEPFGIYTLSANYVNLMQAPDGWLGMIRMGSEMDSDTYERQELTKRKTWVYQTKNKLKETVQILNSSKRNGIRGQSVLARVYFQALSKYYGNIHNTSILKNGSRPSGMFSPESQLSQGLYESFKKEVRENFTGAMNAGKNLVTPDKTKYTNLMLNPRDMDFLKLIESNRSEIYNIYQIPLPLVTTSTMTLNNYQNAICAFYDLSVLPRSKFLYKQLGNFLLGRYKDGDRYELVINEKELPALKERLFERAKKMRDVFVYSEDEIRTETGYESIGDEGNQIWKPANWVPAGDDDYTDDIIRRENDKE